MEDLLNLVRQFRLMHKIRYLLLLLLISFMITLVSSCEKKRDDTSQIIVNSPAELSEYQVGDSIAVKASIIHTIPITSVKVSLLNQDGITVLSPVYLFPGTTSYELELMYPLNKSLGSGIYTLLVSAGDGMNTTNKYTQVMITGIGRFFERVLAVCEPSIQKMIVHGINSEGQFMNLFAFDYTYNGSDISSLQRQLFVLSKSPDRLFAYNLDDLELDYDKYAPVPYPQFNDVTYRNRTYVACGNGSISGYSMSGLMNFSSSPKEDTIPMLVAEHEGFVLSYCERRGGPERFISQFFAGTGVFRASLKMNLTVVSIFGLDMGRCLLIGNENDLGKVYVYDIIGNYILEEIQLTDGMIQNALQVSDNIFLFSHENGIYSYDHSTRITALWLPGEDAHAIVYDDLRQIVYYAAENKVFSHRYPDALLLQEVELPYPVLSLHVQYNK